MHELLEVYDADVRSRFLDLLPSGWTAERDGPLVRCLTARDGFAMLTQDASALSHAELVELVDRTVAYYAQRGLSFEWKTFEHDRDDLPDLLLAAGAVAQEREALVLGKTARLTGPVSAPAGLTIDEVTSRPDLEGIAELKSQVWGDDSSWLASDLEERLAGPDPFFIFAVKDADVVVSAAWLVPLPGTRIAGLWGGSTLAAYRGRGCYRALVMTRANLAASLGYPFLQVDASDASRPILQRLGLEVIGGTTPYKVDPAPAT